jgi:hypothetical protein
MSRVSIQKAIDASKAFEIIDIKSDPLCQEEKDKVETETETSKRRSWFEWNDKNQMKVRTRDFDALFDLAQVIDLRAVGKDRLEARTRDGRVAFSGAPVSSILGCNPQNHNCFYLIRECEQQIPHWYFQKYALDDKTKRDWVNYVDTR